MSVLVGLLVGVFAVEPHLDTQSVYAEFLALTIGAPSSPWLLWYLYWSGHWEPRGFVPI